MVFLTSAAELVAVAKERLRLLGINDLAAM
jgi:hypothetical protein